MTVTRNVSSYVKRLGINLSEMSRKTGIPYNALYKSVGVSNPKRDLRADELTNICVFLGINPMDFANDDTPDGG